MRKLLKRNYLVTDNVVVHAVLHVQVAVLVVVRELVQVHARVAVLAAQVVVLALVPVHVQAVAVVAVEVRVLEDVQATVMDNALINVLVVEEVAEPHVMVIANIVHHKVM